jgi:hypothetical protein
MTRRTLLVLIALLGCHPMASSEAGTGPIDYAALRRERRLPAVRATGVIVIDGKLDEPDWGRAPLATDFVQNEPREGEPATEQTEVRILYDADNLYIGVFAHDREPHRLIVNDLKKDFNTGAGDTFEIVLDTFHDERNGYMFATNPAGAKWDAQMVNEGREVNPNWDGLWTVRTRIVETGWFAEIAIPFRTLRFRSADPQTWGINFLRRIRRRNEDSYWAPLPRIYRLNRVSMAGTLEGLSGVRPGADLRVKPYVLGSAVRSTRAAVGSEVDAGFDIKYGVASGLTWDFTLNTDFSQVEADEQQVNITRFSLFFPEKRDFFLENSGVFQFGGGGDRGGMPGGGPGPMGGGGRTNSVQQDLILFFSRRIGLSDEGREIPILGGTRLTGRVGPYTLGALNIQQRRQGATPSTNFTALRLRRNLLANSDIGVIFLNKDASGAHYNRVVGADANFRFFQNLNLNGYVAKTFSPLSVVGAPSEDLATNVGMSYRDQLWQFRAAYATFGQRFNDEMGFAPRLGVNTADLYGGMHLRPKAVSRWLRELAPHYQLEHVTRRADGGLESRYVDYHLPLNFQDGSFLEIGANPTVEQLVRPFTLNRRRGVVVPAGHYEYNEYFALWRTNASAPIAFNGRWGIGDFYDGYKHSYQFGVSVRPHYRLNASLNVSHNNIRLPWGDFTTYLVTSRINYSFSTRTFVNALLQYNTDAREWSSNIRFNIIHRPLSDLFVVYNERRDTASRALLDRALIAKVTYMVAF